MTERPRLPEVDGYGGPITRDEVATLLEQAYDAGRSHANEELKRLLHANCTPSTNPGAHKLANDKVSRTRE